MIPPILVYGAPSSSLRERFTLKVLALEPLYHTKHSSQFGAVPPLVRLKSLSSHKTLNFVENVLLHYCVIYK